MFFAFEYGAQIISHTVMKCVKFCAVNICVNLNTAGDVPILLKHKTVKLGTLYQANSMGDKQKM